MGLELAAFNTHRVLHFFVAHPGIATDRHRVSKLCKIATSGCAPVSRVPDHKSKEEKTMKYMITWNERPQGSPIEYENAQKRILEVFSPWKAPANFKIEAFVIRVGDWGGYMLMECDDPLEVHKFCSMLPAFTFEARPVRPVADAIRVELEAMAYRDGLKGK